jgi:hypothetical protein
MVIEPLHTNGERCFGGVERIRKCGVYAKTPGLKGGFSEEIVRFFEGVDVSRVSSEMGMLRGIAGAG